MSVQAVCEALAEIDLSVVSAVASWRLMVSDVGGSASILHSSTQQMALIGGGAAVH